MQCLFIACHIPTDQKICLTQVSVLCNQRQLYRHKVVMVCLLCEGHFKDRQQLAGHDSRYITLLCSYCIYNIILYIKL